MKTIWKFNLQLKDEQTVKMPKDSYVVHLGEQSGRLCLWAFCDTEAPLEDRTFRIYGTGHEIKDGEGFLHCGTVIAGSFVWHIYEGDD